LIFVSCQKEIRPIGMAIDSVTIESLPDSIFPSTRNYSTNHISVLLEEGSAVTAESRLFAGTAPWVDSTTRLPLHYGEDGLGDAYIEIYDYYTLGVFHVHALRVPQLNKAFSSDFIEHFEIKPNNLYDKGALTIELERRETIIKMRVKWVY
jgi:hypothetical protein